MSLGTHDDLAGARRRPWRTPRRPACSWSRRPATSIDDSRSSSTAARSPIPAAYPQVLSTTFTNQNDALTGYSCTGPEVDFAAPGDNIFSTVPVGSCMLCSPHGYAAVSGTSMASPHLAGTVALLLSAGITDQGAPGCSTTSGPSSARPRRRLRRQRRRRSRRAIRATRSTSAAAWSTPATRSCRCSPANDPPVATDDTPTTARTRRSTSPSSRTTPTRTATR